MDMTQIAMQLRTQMLQQNGGGEGQSGQVSESGTSFADLIMNMLSNTQGNVQSSGLLNDVLANANLQQGNQADSLLQNSASDSGFTDIEYFASEYGGVLNTLAQGILESKSDIDALDFSLLQNKLAESGKTQVNSDNTLNPEQTQSGQIQSEQPKGEIKAEQTQSEQPRFEQPEGEIKAEEPVLSRPAEKPEQTLTSERTQSEQTQSEQPKGEVGAEQPQSEQPVLNQPTEKPVQNVAVPEQTQSEQPKGEVKAEQPQSEQPVLNQPTEKPVQTLMPEQTQSEQSKGEVKAEQPQSEQPVLNQPTGKPVQVLMPEQTKSEQTKPEQIQSEQPKGEVKAEQPQSEQPVLNQPTGKPVQALMLEQTKSEQTKPEQIQSEQPKAEIKAEQPQFEQPVLNQPTEKPVQILMPEQTQSEQPQSEQSQSEQSQSEQPEGEVKSEQPQSEQPVLNQPTEKPVQILMPEQTQSEQTKSEQTKSEQTKSEQTQLEQPKDEVKAQEPVLSQPTEKPLQSLFIPNQAKVEAKPEQPQSEQPVLNQPTEKPVQTLMPEGEVRTEQPVLNQPAEKPMQTLMPEDEIRTEQPVLNQPTEKLVQNLFMPEQIQSEQSKGEIKAEQYVPDNEPFFNPSFRTPVRESFEAAEPHEPKKLDIPLDKRNIDTLIRAGILQKAKANNKAEGSRENEQNYYPVTTDNKELSYDDVLQMTNLFAMPGLKSDNSKNEVRLSDFSDSVIKADPMQLSGLLNMVSTGSSIPASNDILGSLYKETSVLSGIPNIDDTAEKNMAAFDFVSKYIESGEVEIVGYKPEDIIKQLSEQQLRQEQNVQKNEKPVEPEAVQSENSDKAVSNNNDMLSVYRTMRTAKENMSLARKSEKTEPVEFETIQNNVSRLDIRFDKIDSEMKMNQTFEAPEKQIAKGVEENLKLGRNEFTVKLKPEGLGEIIVKLVKNDGGKMLMSMTASNVRTAQLLNRNISELQSSLSQQNVEIINPKDMTKTVMPMTPAFEQYYSHQNGGGQQQQQQQQQFNNRNYGYRTYSDVDDDEAFESKANSPVENDGLNIMI